MKPPKPKTDNLSRVVRGGGWYGASAVVVRAAFRPGYTPSIRISHLGFRCAQRGCKQPVDKVETP